MIYHRRSIFSDIRYRGHVFQCFILMYIAGKLSCVIKAEIRIWLIEIIHRTQIYIKLISTAVHVLNTIYGLWMCVQYSSYRNFITMDVTQMVYERCNTKGQR